MKKATIDSKLEAIAKKGQDRLEVIHSFDGEIRPKKDKEAGDHSRYKMHSPKK